MAEIHSPPDPPVIEHLRAELQRAETLLGALRFHADVYFCLTIAFASGSRRYTERVRLY